MKIVLASGSPRRKKLLSFLVDKFEIIPSQIDEEKLARLARTPEEMVVKLAQAKAKAVVKSLQEPALVIGSDLTVVLEGKDGWESLDKPGCKKKARQMLKKLRGKSHKVFTGICVINSTTGEITTDFDASQVRFKDFSQKNLERYLTEFSQLDCAGGYKIQDLSKDILSGVEGSYTNILGLPLKKLIEMLRGFGLPVKKTGPKW